MNVSFQKDSIKGLTREEVSERLYREGYNELRLSKPESIFKILVTPDKAVLWIAGGAFTFLLIVLNVPVLPDLFMFEKIKFPEVIICILAGFSTIIWFEFYKKMRKSRLLS
jgi:hypothetical protein